MRWPYEPTSVRLTHCTQSPARPVPAASQQEARRRGMVRVSKAPQSIRGFSLVFIFPLYLRVAAEVLLKTFKERWAFAGITGGCGEWRTPIVECGCCQYARIWFREDSGRSEDDAKVTARWRRNCI